MLIVSLRRFFMIASLRRLLRCCILMRLASCGRRGTPTKLALKSSPSALPVSMLMVRGGLTCMRRVWPRMGPKGALSDLKNLSEMRALALGAGMRGALPGNLDEVEPANTPYSAPLTLATKSTPGLLPHARSKTTAKNDQSPKQAQSKHPKSSLLWLGIFPNIFKDTHKFRRPLVIEHSNSSIHKFPSGIPVSSCNISRIHHCTQGH